MHVWLSNAWLTFPVFKIILTKLYPSSKMYFITTKKCLLMEKWSAKAFDLRTQVGPKKTFLLLPDPPLADNYNHLVLTSHRIIFETKRIAGANSYMLSNSTFNGCILAFVQLLWSIIQFIIYLFTLGTEPDSIIRDTNMLLKGSAQDYESIGFSWHLSLLLPDVSEIRLIRVRSSELANHAKVLLALTLLCVIFICIGAAWPTGAVIGVLVSLFIHYSVC